MDTLVRELNVDPDMAKQQAPGTKQLTSVRIVPDTVLQVCASKFNHLCLTAVHMEQSYTALYRGGMV